VENLLDYLRWRGDLTLSQSSFNEVDNIVLAMLSFIDFSGLIGKEAKATPVSLAECYRYNLQKYPDGEDFGKIVPRENNDLLKAAALSPRFSDTYVCGFRDEISENDVKQFGAVTFILPDNSIYVAFRGTDDTIVGWKEDFAISYEFPTESQECAARYLAEVAQNHSGVIRIGGHSKGGNLAVYSAAFCPATVQNRIETVYNNDGPGFQEEVVDSPEMERIRSKIYTLVPQSSFIGMILSPAAEYHVIESTAIGGPMQHNPYSWTVSGTSFTHLDSLSKSGLRQKEMLDEWIGGYTPDERRTLTETIFSVLEASGGKTLSELSADKFGTTAAILKAIAAQDKDTRKSALDFVKRLAETLIGNS